MKWVCLFWGQFGFLIQVVLVLVSPRTPGRIDTSSKELGRGPACSVQACGKPWKPLIPASLSRCFRSGGLCGPGSCEAEFRPVHLVTAFVGTECRLRKDQLLIHSLVCPDLYLFIFYFFSVTGNSFMVHK